MTPSETILALNRITDIDLVQSPVWYRQLAEAVNDLLVNDFNALVQLLYRFDVDENKIKASLADNPGTDAADLITHLLLARQLQKIHSRQKTTGLPPDDEEEKW